mmetsp:Transcript_34998/g.74656  ORF Transcript_34998/g.74656 Transcript_34998/m.74656 type:complete len:97 (-) Transcript_34998:3132-3422(-)
MPLEPEQIHSARPSLYRLSVGTDGDAAVLPGSYCCGGHTKSPEGGDKKALSNHLAVEDITACLKYTRPDKNQRGEIPSRNISSPQRSRPEATRESI